jgi:hypothetical protein
MVLRALAILKYMKLHYRFMSKKEQPHRKQKFAIAPIAGFLIGLGLGIKNCLDESKARDPAHPWAAMQNVMIQNYLGLEAYSDAEHPHGTYKFNAGSLMGGLIPLLGGAVGGWGLHKLAVKFGVNRHIPWVSI